jgi:hypothetical protein
MNKKAKVLGKKISIGQPPSSVKAGAGAGKSLTQPAAAPSLITMMAGIQTKFSRLKELRAKISAMKDLYREHDDLVKELLPLFIEAKPDGFIIKREIQIGSEKYRFTPSFYDTKKAEVLAKEWRSTAFPTGTIE